MKIYLEVNVRSIGVKKEIIKGCSFIRKYHLL